MSRLLTHEEIQALLAGGPVVPEPDERVRVGDAVEIVVDGVTLALGRLFSHHGRPCVRVEKLISPSAPEELVR